MRAFVGIVLLILANNCFGTPLMMALTIVVGHLGFDDFSHLVIYSLVAGPFLGILSLYGASKVWKGWKKGLAVVWALIGIAGLVEGLSLQNVMGVTLMVWGGLSFVIGAVAFLIQRRHRTIATQVSR